MELVLTKDVFNMSLGRGHRYQRLDGAEERNSIQAELDSGEDEVGSGSGIRNGNQAQSDTQSNGGGTMVQMPLEPPGYDISGASPGIEEFEIEDDMFGDNNVSVVRESFVSRATVMTKKFVYVVNRKIIHPVTRIVDPLFEMYRVASQYYESWVLKIGNPLVVNRLLYVFLLMIVTFLITKYSNDESVNGETSGGYHTGKFYDIDKIGESVRGYIDPKLMEENLEYLSLMPHITGTKGDLALATYIQKTMKNDGIKVLEFNEMQSFLNYPSSQDTYLKLADDSWKATLYEQGNSKDIQYLAYNPDCLNTNEEVEAEYVFVNYGSEKDFKALEDKGVSLEDKIALVRYGGAGENSQPELNKLLRAQRLKARAVVFVSPLIKLGNLDVDDMIQNLNVALTRKCAGDILTPGWSSEDGYVTRLPWFKSEITPKIPSIPISWKDGAYLINKLKNKGVKFEDGLFSGESSGSDKLKLKIVTDTRATHQIWNIIGSIEGREQSELGVIIGSSRDSTCYGTMEGNTGTVVMLEMVKIFTALQREHNWSPSRSIYFVSLDATQYNLAGSSEWIENKKEQFKKEGYVYIDLNDAIAGDELLIKAHPVLHQIIRQALDKVQVQHLSDKKDSSLHDLYKSQNNGQAPISYDMVELKNYIPFINLINLPSMEVRYGGLDYPKGSCYDSFDNFKRMNVDPSMKKHQELVELHCYIVLALAEQPLIPYDFTSLVDYLYQSVDDLENYAKDLSGGSFHLNADGLRKALAILRNSGGQFQSWLNEWTEFIKESPEPSYLAMHRYKWNENLVLFNSIFVPSDPKPKRQGYFNLLFGTPFMSPATSEGLKYNWNTFPTIRDGLYVGDYKFAQEESNNLANIIMTASSALLDQIY